MKENPYFEPHTSEHKFFKMQRFTRNTKQADRQKFHRRTLSQSPNSLAEILTKDAVRSPKIQKTMNNSINVKGSQKNVYQPVKRSKKKRRQKIKKTDLGINRRRYAAEKSKSRGKASVQRASSKKFKVKGTSKNPPKYPSQKNKHSRRKSKSNLKNKNKKNRLTTVNNRDDDVIKDLLANRIPIKIADMKIPNERFSRQTFDNNSSYYTDDETIGNVLHYPSRYSKDFRSSRYPHSSNSFQTSLELDESLETNKNDEVAGDEASIDRSADNSFLENSNKKKRLSRSSRSNKTNQSPSIHQNCTEEVFTDASSNNISQIPYQKNYDPPPIHLPNLMDQPLGKVLKTLGISAKQDESKNNNAKIIVNSTFVKEEQESKDEKKNSKNSNSRVNETKKIASEILSRIIDELEEMKSNQSKNDKREGFPCRLTGSWLSIQAGLKLDMRVLNRTITVKLSKGRMQAVHREMPLNVTWNSSGQAPFKLGAPFSLLATDTSTKSLGAFVGTCRVCHGIDTITGIWSFARPAKDCKDVQISTSIFNDIFRRVKQQINGTENFTTIQNNVTDVNATSLSSTQASVVTTLKKNEKD